MAATDKKTTILTMIDEAKKGYDKYRSEFKVLEMGYINQLPPEALKSLESRGLSHIAPKIIKAKVRKVAISVLKTYFENDEFAKIGPEKIDEDEFDTAKKLQRALDLWTTKRLNLYTIFKPIVYDGLIYGTPITKIYWNDGLRVARVKIKDLWLDPDAQTVYDIQYCVNRVITTVGRLKKQFGRKFKWRNFIGASASSDGTKQLSTVDIGDASRIEVMDVYRLVNGEWTVSTVLPDQSFIRVDEPLKDGLPFIIGNIEPQFVSIEESGAVEAYGGSFIEPMIPLQDEYTVMRNKQIDAIDRHLEHRFLAERESGLKEADLASKRRKINVGNLNQVRELQLPRLQESIFNIDRLDSEMQEVSGITKYNQGLNDKKNLNQTATGISILTQEGNAVIEDIIRALNESFFEPVIRRMVRLIYKYDTGSEIYGIDRNKDIRFTVSINAGIGSVNPDIMLNNIATAEGSAISNAKLNFEMQNIDGAAKYLEVLDELFIEKLKVLRLKTVIPTLKGEQHGRNTTESQGSEAGVEGPGGAQDARGVPNLSVGAEGQV